MYVSALQLPISAFSKAFDCKDSANERNVSSLTNCRVQPILCKDSANERNDKTEAELLMLIYAKICQTQCGCRLILLLRSWSLAVDDVVDDDSGYCHAE